MFPSEPDARRFDEMVRWIRSQFRVLEPVQACERLMAGTLPSRAAIITFDDGYRDNLEVATPILERHGVRAAFFIATGYMEGGAMFNDRVFEALRTTERRELDLAGLLTAEDKIAERPDEEGAVVVRLGEFSQRRSLAERLVLAIKHRPPEERLDAVRALEEQCGVQGSFDPMMSPEEVSALAKQGMAIGGHTRTHPILESVPDPVARDEIEGGRADLRALLRGEVDLFAYPNGRFGRDFSDRHREMVEDAGYRFAFTTDPGAATARSDPRMLPRFTPWDRSHIRFGVRALRNLSGD
ncbi:polysaccharide deacetylase family protein [Zeimonas arvi]|uniref:Polysaccharide deacetylase family protein n=2 Tax=Zeimonas arvi TaxID=2498847 RepID=A0A5C8NZK7_9BURK|nr:polysaccharide deacetylase family protein [Zeimonas arvi]